MSSKPVVISGRAGVKTPVRPVSYFLDTPTAEMFHWYYDNETTQFIEVEDIDERTSVVQLKETMGERVRFITTTIGNSIKRQIVQQYIFYHPEFAKNVSKPQGCKERKGGLCREV